MQILKTGVVKASGDGVNPNLIANSFNFTGWGNVANTTGRFNGFPVAYMDYTSGTSGTKDLAKNGITAVTANEVYTFSFWCKSSNQFTMTVFFYNNNTGVQVASAKLDGATATTATDGRVSVVVTTTWTKHTITWTFNTNTTSLAKNLLFRIAYGNDLFVSQVKL